MAGISLRHIDKTYAGDVRAVRDFNLEVRDKEFLVMVGPSGCGKSTVLRMIAGLEEITAGELYIGDRLVNNVSARDRDIAMVFQNYALYPYMTTYNNMAFGLTLRKVPFEIIEERIDQSSMMLSLQDLLERYPSAMSGGQRQRVALGRSIVREPKVFLLDEPLSNLDSKLRTSMRTEIIKLHQRLATTFVYVTHDQTEAMTMGSKIVVMKDGVMQQVDAPQMLYDNPVNTFVAGFIGVPQMNFIDARLVQDGEGYSLEFEAITLPLPPAVASRIKYDNLVGKPLILGIRPEDIKLGGEEEGGVPCVVDFVENLGNELIVYLQAEGYSKPLITRAYGRARVRSGDKAWLRFVPEYLHLFDAATEQSVLKVRR